MFGTRRRPHRARKNVSFSDRVAVFVRHVAAKVIIVPIVAVLAYLVRLGDWWDRRRFERAQRKSGDL